MVTDDGALLASTCSACGRPEFPARATCPACGADSVTAALPRTATLVGHTAVLHQPPGAKVEAPYAVGVARFPNGLAVMGRLLVDEPIVGEAVATVGHEPYAGGRSYAFIRRAAEA